MAAIDEDITGENIIDEDITGEDRIDEDINAEIFQVLRTARTACIGWCNIFAVVGAAFKRLAGAIGL